MVTIRSQIWQRDDLTQRQECVWRRSRTTGREGEDQASVRPVQPFPDDEWVQTQLYCILKPS